MTQRRISVRAGRRTATWFANSLSVGILVGPALGVYIFMMIIPIIIAFGYSLTDWNGISSTFDWAGIDNYRRTFADERFQRAAVITGLIAFICTAVLNVLGVGLAVALNRAGAASRLLRPLFFFPIVLSPIVVGFIWQAQLNYQGIANGLLESLGVGRINFLGEPTLAVVSLAWVTIWQSLGFVMVLYLAALQTIPREIYDASSIDGATPAQQFARITIPLLAPATTTTTVLLLVFFMRLYDYVVVLTGGGPGGASETVAFQIVRTSFSGNQYAYGSAQAIVLLGSVAVISVVTLWGLGKREAYLA